MEILQATPQDTQAILEFFINYRFALQERHWLEWKYNANPAGEALRFKIIANGHIAGAVAIIPQWFTYRGRTLIGLQTVDGLLGMEVRGKGHFNELMDFLTKQIPAGVTGDYFYLSFPSLAVSIKAHENAGWHKLSNFNLFTCLLTPGHLFRQRAMPNLRQALEIPWLLYRRWIMGPENANVQIRSDVDYTVDLNRMVDTGKVSGDRSAAFMKWRVVDNPRDRIFTLLIYDKETWVGYAVCKIVGRAVEIVEMRLKTPKAAYIKALIRHIHTHHWGDTIDFWSLGPSPLHRLFRGAAFVWRTFSGVLFLYGTNRLSLPNEPGEWEITYLDSDW
jgi:hypothetical protein